jgi:hypothetical protein
MHCEVKLKLRSHNTCDCLIEVVTKAGLTVILTLSLLFSLRKGFSNLNMASIYQGWFIKCIAPNLAGKQSCQKSQKYLLTDLIHGLIQGVYGI